MEPTKSATWIVVLLLIAQASLGLGATADPATNAVDRTVGTGEDLRGDAEDGAGAAGDAASSVGDTGGDLAGAGGSAAGDVVDAVQEGDPEAAGQAAREGVDEAVGALIRGVDEAVLAVIGAVNELPGIVIGTVNEVVTALIPAINQIVLGVIKIANGAVGEGIQAINDGVMAVIGPVNDGALAAVGAINEGVTTARGALNDAALAAIGAINNAAGRVIAITNELVVTVVQAVNVAVGQVIASVNMAVGELIGVSNEAAHEATGASNDAAGTAIGGSNDVASGAIGESNALTNLVTAAALDAVESCEETGWRIEGTSECRHLPVGYHDAGDGSGVAPAGAASASSAGGGPPMAPSMSRETCPTDQQFAFTVQDTDGDIGDPGCWTYDAPIVVRMPDGGVAVLSIEHATAEDGVRLTVNNVNSKLSALRIDAGGFGFEYDYLDGRGERAVHPKQIVADVDGAFANHVQGGSGGPEISVDWRVTQGTTPATARYFAIPDAASDPSTFHGLETGELHSASGEAHRTRANPGRLAITAAYAEIGDRHRASLSVDALDVHGGTAVAVKYAPDRETIVVDPVTAGTDASVELTPDLHGEDRSLRVTGSLDLGRPIDLLAVPTNGETVLLRDVPSIRDLDATVIVPPDLPSGAVPRCDGEEGEVETDDLMLCASAVLEGSVGEIRYSAFDGRIRDVPAGLVSLTVGPDDHLDASVGQGPGGTGGAALDARGDWGSLYVTGLRSFTYEPTTSCDEKDRVEASFARTGPAYIDVEGSSDGLPASDDGSSCSDDSGSGIDGTLTFRASEIRSVVISGERADLRWRDGGGSFSLGLTATGVEDWEAVDVHVSGSGLRQLGLELGSIPAVTVDGIRSLPSGSLKASLETASGPWWCSSGISGTTSLSNGATEYTAKVALSCGMVGIDDTESQAAPGSLTFRFQALVCSTTFGCTTIDYPILRYEFLS